MGVEEEYRMRMSSLSWILVDRRRLFSEMGNNEIGVDTWEFNATWQSLVFIHACNQGPSQFLDLLLNIE